MKIENEKPVILSDAKDLPKQREILAGDTVILSNAKDLLKQPEILAGDSSLRSE